MHESFTSYLAQIKLKLNHVHASVRHA